MALLGWPAREAKRRRRGAMTTEAARGSGVRKGPAVASATSAAAATAAAGSGDAPISHAWASPEQRQPQGAGITTETGKRRMHPTSASQRYSAAVLTASSVSLAILCSTPCCSGLPAARTSAGAHPSENAFGFGRLLPGNGFVRTERLPCRIGHDGAGADDGGLFGERAVGAGDDARLQRCEHPQQSRLKEGEGSARQEAGRQGRPIQRHGLVGRGLLGLAGGMGKARRRVEKERATSLRRALGVRGGGRRSWFTGYEDTTQEESSSEEGETTEYEEGLSDGETTDDAGGGDDAAGNGGESGKGGLKTVDAGEKKKGRQGNGDGRENEEVGDGKKDEDNSDAASLEARRRALDDIYGRTIARRKAMSLVFRVLQRTLIKTAFLLVAFQIFPWLKNNFLVQCLLVGSLLLQTVTELVGIARAADAAGKPGKGRGQRRPGDDPVKGSGADTPPSSSSTPGVIGGLMKAFSPEDEHRQHLDFQRMNDMFDKDAEALATASQPKGDVPTLLLPTGPMGSSALPMAGMMMKAFKGLAGKQENKKTTGRARDGKGSGGLSSPPSRDDVEGNSGTRGRKEGRRHRRDRGKKRGAEPAQEDAAQAHEGQTRADSVKEDDGINKTDNSDVDRSQTERFALQNVRYFDADGRRTAAGKESGMPSEDGRVDRGGPVEGTGGQGQAADVGTSGGHGGSAAGGPGRVGEGGPKNSTAVAASKPEKRVFVVKFRPGHGPEEGQEQQMELLSATVSFLAANGNNATDEVVLLLESGGGEVSTFGLAAAKLARLKDSGFKLTVCVDKIAASGGYMMACIADKLVVAPFAMLGSIGVVGGMPNFNKALKKFGVDYFHFTAGQQKSLVGPFQEVTKANQAMQQRQMDTIHTAFKGHVQRYRPTVDVEAVGTGEVWLGQQAVELNLADEVGTAMEYLQGRMSDSQVFLIKQHKKKIGGGTTLLRALLLGPLARAGGFGSRVSTLFEIARMLLLPQQRPRYTRGAAAGGRDLFPAGRSDYQARPFPHLSDGNFDEDSLTRALTKALHAAGAASMGGSVGSAAGAGGGLDGVVREEGEGVGSLRLAGGVPRGLGQRRPARVGKMCSDPTAARVW